jgi:hypothetical protein
MFCTPLELSGRAGCALGYTWAGVRTADLKSATDFFADSLRLSVIHEGKGLVQFDIRLQENIQFVMREGKVYKR